jgi:hypothetical protein
MVDLAIASNFARELTESQFAEQRHAEQRRADQRPATRRQAAEPAARRAAQVDPAVARAAGRPQPTAPERSPLARLMSRLVQVRG